MGKALSPCHYGHAPKGRGAIPPTGGGVGYMTSLENVLFRSVFGGIESFGEFFYGFVEYFVVGAA